MLVQYRNRRRARNLNPIQAAPDDPEVQRLVAERDRLRAELLRLRTACIRGEVVDNVKARAIFSRFFSECRQSIRSAMTAPGGFAHSVPLHEKLLYETFPRVLDKLRKGLCRER